MFKKILKLILESMITFLSKLKGINFPQEKNYYWRGKLEILFHSFERETVDLCRKFVKPDMNIVDIGAHIGYYSILFSKLIGSKGQVFAFEPDPISLKLLQKNVKRYKNITIIPKAISDKSAIVEFYRDQERSGCHSLSPANFRREKIEVEATTLDSFILEIGSPKIDFIKIDIEGWEPQAITGMKKTLQANKDIMLVIEFSPDNLSWSKNNPIEFLEDLHRFGFNIHTIKKDNKIELVEQNNFKKIEDFIKKSGNNYINIFCKRKN